MSLAEEGFKVHLETIMVDSLHGALLQSRFELLRKPLAVGATVEHANILSRACVHNFYVLSLVVPAKINTPSH